MVDSWIRKFYDPMNFRNYAFIHSIPQLLNIPISCLDRNLTAFSTSVEGKRLRKTISAGSCQIVWNNSGIVH